MGGELAERTVWSSSPPNSILFLSSFFFIVTRLQFVHLVCIQGRIFSKGPFLLCFWHPWQFEAELWNWTFLYKSRLKPANGLVSKPQLLVPQRGVENNSSKLTTALDTWSYESGKCKNRCSKTEESSCDQWNTVQILAHLPLKIRSEKTSYAFKCRNWRCTVEERLMVSFLCPLEEIYLQLLCSGYQLTQTSGYVHAVCMLESFWTWASFDRILLWYLNLLGFFFFFELWVFCFISLNQAISRQVCQKDVTTLSLSSVWGSSDFMNICFSLGQFWCLILALAK